MVKELRTGALWRAVTAEFIGMTLFVFIGIASAIGTSEHEGPDQEVKVALAFGLAIATLAQSLGHVSGAHLNPAITVGLLVSCQISALRALLYILAQMLGAVLASGIVYGIRPKDVKALGLNVVAENMTQGKAFGVEFLATFQLVLCVLAATDSRRSDVKGSAPLAIGLSVGLGHLVAISYTGCGINPARSFGPAVIMKSFKKHWVFWVAPLMAGVAASLLYDFVLQPHSEPYTKRLRVVRGRTDEETSPLIEAPRGSESQWPRR
ncbi:aquaporin-1a.2 [Tachysurus fulvidraco]|uniref:aquaporin-1a.2 n=1 Tax=Tachysurus fulvidraco TaxID=1234273 RepID=UPI001FEF5B92|nr:aquaporin-1a.2 [Tachysurus fulvidraco]